MNKALFTAYLGFLPPPPPSLPALMMTSKPRHCQQVSNRAWKQLCAAHNFVDPAHGWCCLNQWDPILVGRCTGNGMCTGGTNWIFRPHFHVKPNSLWLHVGFFTNIVRRPSRIPFGSTPGPPKNPPSAVRPTRPLGSSARLVRGMFSVVFSVLASKVCPVNLEATLFAVLMAIANFGSSDPDGREGQKRQWLWICSGHVPPKAPKTLNWFWGYDGDPPPKKVFTVEHQVFRRKKEAN